MTKFVEISLPGPDYIAGPRYFPSNVISGYNAPYHEYTAESWVVYMKQQVEQFAGADVMTAYSAINSGTPKERVWFGYVYRGGHANPGDFKPAKDVKDAHAYNVEH
ncbi:hypothetical protein M422DRAFT_194387 [Sphaerobolus stellatus SS14]|uniref:Uncharacterized protein n=1 Tax=Sphaerobolus stellatus (strain SS14) TaxID=990650 RepID=A0A0C9UHK0_SPHS4|nr:hypothetical protein M422DRAFT_194387 [Sphaerobolus stellatus SS14]